MYLESIMKKWAYGIIAISISCSPKKESVKSSPEQPREESIAHALANYLLENAKIRIHTLTDTRFCQRYTNETQGINYIMVCYRAPTDVEGDSLRISFDTNATIFIDKDANGTLDDILVPGEATPCPLDTLSKKIQSDAKESYTELLRKLYDATFNAKK